MSLAKLFVCFTWVKNNSENVAYLLRLIFEKYQESTFRKIELCFSLILSVLKIDFLFLEGANAKALVKADLRK
jgi:hypothetical protein